MGSRKKDSTEHDRISPHSVLSAGDSTFRGMADSLPLAIYLSVGKEQTCEYVNPKFVELFGYTLEEVPTAEQWWPLAYPDETYRNQVAEERNGKVDRAIETKRPIEPMDAVVTSKDGSKKYIRWGYVTIGDKSYAYGQDLTESRLAEEVLRASEKHFHTLFEQAPLGYQSLDEDGRFLEVNQAWLEMLGYQRDEVIGKWAGDFLHPDYREAFKERFPLFKAAGTTHSEFNMLHKDGTPRIIDIEGRIGYRSNGSFKQTHCILSDITERKQAEEALQASEAEFRSTINDLLVGVVVHAADTSIVLSNPQARHILGLSEEQMTGKMAVDSVWSFIHLDLSPMNVAEYPVNRVISAGEGISNETIGIRRPDRKEITWVLLSAVPLITNEGVLNRVIVNFLDITLRKEAEEEELRLREQLFQAKKMETIGQLAGGVAHDFNNILQSILGHAELAEREVDPNNPAHNDLQEIQQAARHAADLTRQLLTFARKQDSTVKLLNLNHSVQKMLKMMQPLIGQNIDLVWEPASELWTVKMDATQIDQILVNLCINARDAISGANGRVNITTRNIHIKIPQSSYGQEIIPGDYVVLSVSDTGCGMPLETKEKLFEPFFTTKEVGKGTGLGLSTVYGIAQQNHGYIDIRSEPGKGSSFQVYLPRDKNGNTTSGINSSAARHTCGTETILLVEDDPVILKATIRILDSLGYTVLAAASPQKALHLADEYANKIDLLLTDVIMPGMDGHDLAGRIRERLPQLKILFISGHTGNILDRLNGSQNNLGPLLPKPFSIEQIAAKIRDVLDTES